MRAGFTCDSTADWITGSQVGGASPSIALCPPVIGLARSPVPASSGRTGFSTWNYFAVCFFFLIILFGFFPLFPKNVASKEKKRLGDF